MPETRETPQAEWQELFAALALEDHRVVCQLDVSRYPSRPERKARKPKANAEADRGGRPAEAARPT